MTATPKPAATAIDQRVRQRLLAMRALRSVGQGLLVVVFPLYLAALGWSGVQIGALFTAVVAAHAGLTLLSGPLSDRYGRRGFLLLYEVILLASAALALSSDAGWAITLAAVGGGFGRGINGAAGPFGPVEQAWLARVTPRTRRGATFSLNTALGSFGMALGALLAVLPALWSGLRPAAAAYRPVFVLVLLTAAAVLALLTTLRDSPPAPVDDDRPASRPEENRRLLAIAGVNAINGMAIGLIGPLITYWFHLRYGVGPAHIGPVMALAFAATGATALLTGRLAREGRLVCTVVGLRSVGLVLLLVFPLMPSFGWASTLYIVRAALNRGTIGARQALNLSLISDRRRGLAATLSALSTQVPRAAGPLLAGAAFSAGALIAPFYVAAALQAVYLLSYRHIFSRYEREMSTAIRRRDASRP